MVSGKYKCSVYLVKVPYISEKRHEDYKYVCSVYVVADLSISVGFEYVCLCKGEFKCM